MKKCRNMGEKALALYKRKYMLEIGLNKYANMMKNAEIEELK